MESGSDPLTGASPVVSQGHLPGRVTPEPQQVAKPGSDEFERFATCSGCKTEHDQELEPAEGDRGPQS